MISAIIIVKNEEKNIYDCLSSLKWVDELIVVDSGSTDKTVSIAQSFTNKVYYKNWEGFGPQKNYALSLATNDWILSIDADERVTPELQKEIETTLQNPTYSGYYIPHRSFFCGRLIKHGGWGESDNINLRLFKRQKTSFSNSLVHECAIVEGRIGHLQSPLIHYSYTSLEHVIYKMNLYSTLGAQQKYEEGKRLNLFMIVLRSLWMFIRTYLIKMSCLDGKEGFMLAVSNAEGCYYKYMKLLMMYKNEKR